MHWDSQVQMSEFTSGTLEKVRELELPSLECIQLNSPTMYKWGSGEKEPKWKEEYCSLRS